MKNEAASTSSSRENTPVFSSFNLRALFSLSHFLFGGLMLSTAFVNDITEATGIIATCGICWAIMMWAPFSMLGEFTRILFDSSRPQSHLQPEEQPLNGSSDDDLDAGLVLGVHNAYVVLPQFLVSFFGSILFYLIQSEVDAEPRDRHPSPTPESLPEWINTSYGSLAEAYIPKDPQAQPYVPINRSEATSKITSGPLAESKHPPEPIGVLLRIGGVSSLIAGFIALKIPSPNSLH